jgi:hypothetical protein
VLAVRRIGRDHGLGGWGVNHHLYQLRVPVLDELGVGVDLEVILFTTGFGGGKKIKEGGGEKEWRREEMGGMEGKRETEGMSGRGGDGRLRFGEGRERLAISQKYSDFVFKISAIC